MIKTILKLTITIILLAYNFIALGQTPVPRIQSFSPLSGVTNSHIIIKGTHFSKVKNENIVYFGAVRAKLDSASESTLYVSVPAGAIYAPLMVCVNGLNAYSIKSFTPTFHGDSTLRSNSFLKAVSYPMARSADKLGISDLDSDGWADIILPLSEEMSVQRNSSSQDTFSFNQTNLYLARSANKQLCYDDVNGDGKKDIIVSQVEHVNIYRNTSSPGNISFDTSTIYFFNRAWSDISLNDVDGDGRPDIILSENDKNKILVLRNITEHADSVAFSQPIEFFCGTSGVSTTGRMCVADFDLDGKPDLCVTNDGEINVSFFRNTSTPGIISFDPQIFFNIKYRSLKVIPGDVDGDGKYDLAFSNYFDNTISVFRNKSTSGKIEFDSLGILLDAPNPIDMCFGDLNGDGKIDMGENGWNEYISVFENHSTVGHIKFSPKIDYSATNGSGLSFAVNIADINNDGKADLIAAGVGFNRFMILKNNVASVLAASGLIFSSALKENYVSLIWKTLDEKNVSFFYIEKSNDGVNFYNIGKIAAKEKQGRDDYSFTDLEEIKKTRYYRLKIIDFDDAVSYSKTLKISVTDNITLNVYPNPARNVTFVQHPAVLHSIIKMQDINGRLIKIITPSKNSSQTSINLDGVAKGTYVISFIFDNKVVGKKITVQ